MKNTGRNEVQLELALIGHNGMAGVVSALIPHDNIVLFAEQVHHTALALVAPVDTGNCSKHEK